MKLRLLPKKIKEKILVIPWLVVFKEAHIDGNSHGMKLIKFFKDDPKPVNYNGQIKNYRNTFNFTVSILVSLTFKISN